MLQQCEQFVCQSSGVADLQRAALQCVRSLVYLVLQLWIPRCFPKTLSFRKKLGTKSLVRALLRAGGSFLEEARAILRLT